MFRFHCTSTRWMMRGWKRHAKFDFYCQQPSQVQAARVEWREFMTDERVEEITIAGGSCLRSFVQMEGTERKRWSEHKSWSLPLPTLLSDNKSGNWKPSGHVQIKLLRPTNHNNQANPTNWRSHTDPTPTNHTNHAPANGTFEAIRSLEFLVVRRD